MISICTSPCFYLMVTVVILVSLTTSSVTASSELPSIAFWDSSLNAWPSDLISVSEYNRRNITEEQKVLDFLPLENPHIIQGQSNLNIISKSNDPNGQFLAGLFNSGNDEIEAKTWNGAWIDEIVLPAASTIPHLSEFQLSCGSGWSVKVRYNNSPGDSTQDQVITVTNGNILILAVVNGAWITADEYNPTLNPTASPTSVSENNSPPLLNGTVLFAQFQIMPSKNGIQGDHQPHLTAYRKTLVMLNPHNMDDAAIKNMTVSVLNTNDTVLSDLVMNDPSQIPKQQGYIDLGNTNVDDIDFPSSLDNAYIIQGQSNLNSLKDDEDAVVLTNLLNTQNTNVNVKTRDGSWISDFYLPDGNTVPSNSKVQLTCDSGWGVNILYPNVQLEGVWRSQQASRGDVIVIILVNGVWIHEDDIEHSKYIFGHSFYTAVLEQELVKPGMVLRFTAVPTDSNDQEKVGILSDFEVGATTELMLTTIDVGMLTPPRNEFSFRDDVTAHEEYFETAPLSRLIVVQYETIHLTEIMLPSGKFYDTVSDDDGGWHSGDMRQHIGKVLISHGIDMANYGIHSSKGDSESSHPFTCALLTGHNTVGLYQNGRVVHGGSGGNGMITLDNSLGNEFSHEVGHNYGLGHFVGEFDGSVHRPAEEINSSWGWDSKANIFRTNFDPSNSGSDQCLNSECQSAYQGKFRFGTDSMAGGDPMWPDSNRFTMYTPYVAKIIQSFLENKAVWDPSSSTGFRKFHQSTDKMEEYVNPHNGGKAPLLYRVPVTTIVGYYDPSPDRGLPDYVYPALHGAYGYVYNDDGKDDGSGCQLKVRTSFNGDLFYTLTTEIHSTSSMNKFHINIVTSDGPFEAVIDCFGVERTSLALNGPNANDPLIYTVNGIAFDSTTTSPTKVPTKAPTPSPTKAPTLSPTRAPTLSPAVSPTFSPTKAPTPSPAVSPTFSPIVSPPTSPTTLPTITGVDPWFIDSANVTVNGTSIGVRNDIYSGPQNFSVQLFEADCTLPLDPDGIISLQMNNSFIFPGSHIFYSLMVDMSKLESSTAVEFDDITLSSGTISFCSKLTTETSNSLEVASKSVVFNVDFNLSNLLFSIDDINVSEEAIEEINLDISFVVTACACDNLYVCSDQSYLQGDSAPEFRLCITPVSDGVTISNLQLTLVNIATQYEYKPATIGTSQPVFDELTSWFDIDSTKVVETRLVSPLFDDSNTIVTLSGMVSLEGRNKKVELESIEFEIDVEPSEKAQDVETKGCFASIWSLFSDE